MKKILLLIILILAGGLILWNIKDSDWPNNPLDDQTTTQPNNQSAQFNFDAPKKSAHYESNTPAHGGVLPGVPINIVLDFNFDLHEISSIKIIHNGKDYGIGETVIDSNKLTMRRAMDEASPDGVYRVEYNACWPDRSCHDGYFQFAINQSLQEQATDLTGQDEVIIEMQYIAFALQAVRISKGTTVTWKNLDQATHYVNTDSHPAHTYYPSQNSPALDIDETYALTFNEPGVYPYHCTAHADVMKGIIIVK
ncbi:MAG: plastocyanin/azurin family copper-binding protein [bacterium]|nr:plastocyanin/azurin family copper-binding protein [bacterium]